MSFLLHWVESDFDRGVAGWLEAAVLGLSIASALAALVLSFRGPNSQRAARRLAWLAALSLLGMVLGAAWITTQARALSIALLSGAASGPDPYWNWKACRAEEAISQCFSSVELCALGSTATLVPLLAALWRMQRESLRRAGVVALGCLLLVCTLTVSAYLARARVPFHYCGEWREHVECVLETLADMRAALDMGMRLLVVVAAVGIAIVVPTAIVAARNGGVIGKRSAALAWALLALGVAAFTATRGMARDAGRLLQPKNSTASAECWRTVPGQMPAQSRCVSGDAFALWVSPLGAAEFNGYAIDRPEALGPALAERRDSYLRLDLGPAPHHIELLASAETPIATLIPWLRTAQRAGYSEIGIYAALPIETQETATLGALPRAPGCCSMFFRLDASAVRIGTFATWGELARALGAGVRRVSAD